MIQTNPLTLSHEERALIAAFRRCDARGKYMTLACVHSEVEEAPKPRPRLTLVRCDEDRDGPACTTPGYTVVTRGG